MNTKKTTVVVQATQKAIVKCESCTAFEQRWNAYWLDRKHHDDDEEIDTESIKLHFCYD